MAALASLLQHAEAERDQAVAALHRAEEQLRRLQAQAEQLRSYRAEYQQRWSAQFSHRGTMDIVQCYQSFTQRLNEALTQQQQQAATAEASCHRLRDKRMAAEVRAASVRKLIERRSAEQRQVQDRREQRQTDETAQLSRWRTDPAGPARY